MKALKTLKTPKSEKPSNTDEYRSVTIQCSEGACAAAKSIANKHILLRFVHLFPLPLPECDGRPCSCRYRHHQDRRDPEDRRSPYTHTVYLERRSRPDRRGSKR